MTKTIHDQPDRSTAGASGTGPTWNSRLAIRADGATRRLLPEIKRSMSLVDSQLRDVLRDLANGVRPWPLLLTGAAGGGKTFAALSLCDFVQTAGFWTLETACDAILARGDEKARLIREARVKNLLVLDEIGIRDRTGDLERTTLKRILDLREQLQGRRTVVISNRTPSELAAVYDDPIVSRLACGTRFTLDGADRRMKR